MSPFSPYILWLPSWYPNRFEPCNGDFIQRHARATALYGAVVVIHFAAPGEGVHVKKSEVVITESGNLTELVIYNAFKPTGIKLSDKIRYNLQFYKEAKKFIASYFGMQGLPKIVHAHVPVKAGNIARWIQKKYGIKYIVSEHASSYMPEVVDSYFKRHIFYKRQVAKVFQNAISVTNVSAAIGDVLRKLFRLQYVVTIHNTVNTNHFNYSDSKNPVFTFIHVSTLTEQKNVMGILKTFAQLLRTRTDCNLQLVGPKQDAVRDFIKNNNLETRIEMIGEVRYEEVAGYMKKAHVLLMFSKHENFPCVVIEALCCGLPVVSSNVAGIAEAVNDSNGILVPSENETELLRAIVQIKENYSIYDRIAISKKAVNDYSYETIGRQIFNLYYTAPDSAG